MATSYVKWNDPKVEPSINDEQGKIDSMITLINRIQQKNYDEHNYGFRGTHVKTQAIAKGTLTISPDLPPHLSQGLFAHAKKSYPVAIRFANEPIFHQDDRAPGPRGAGLKVFNIEDSGPWLDVNGSETHTQDFTFNNAPILELTDLPTCLEIFTLREKYFHDPEGLKQQLEKRKDKDLQFAPGTLPNRHFLSYVMYSQSAYRYGDYIVKYALFPTGEYQKQLEERAQITNSSSPFQHSEWLAAFFDVHDAEFEFRVQLCQNLEQQSVEDCSVEWDESKYPFETVGKVVLPKGQDVLNKDRLKTWDDGMKLNTWYGLEAHRPLGSVNRLRKQLYQGSVKKREALNGKSVGVVSDISQIP